MRFIKKILEALLFCIDFVREKKPRKNDKAIWSPSAPKKYHSNYGEGPFIVTKIFYGGCSCGKGAGHIHTQACRPDWNKYVYLRGNDGLLLKNKIYNFPEKIPLSYLQRLKK